MHEQDLSKATPAKPLALPQILALNAYWLGLSFMWNALHPIILPALLLPYIPQEHKNTYLGLLTFTGLIIAMLVQPLSGAVSDRWISRFGRRRPLLSIGTAATSVFLLVLGGSGSLLWIVVAYLGLQTAANLAQGPLQGLWRDRVPAVQLGRASSVKSLIDILGLVLASFAAGRLMATNHAGPRGAVLLILIVVFVCAAITILLTSENPSRRQASRSERSFAVGFKVNFAQNASYWWLIGERAVFLLGVYGLQVFGQFYLQDALRVADPARETGNLLSAIGASTIVLALVGGWLTDRFGGRRVLFLGSTLTGAGLLPMVLGANAQDVVFSGGIVGAGIGLFLTANWALANQLAPPDQAGEFLGLGNLATAGAAALARLQGPAVDMLNAARPDEWLGYRGIFAFGIFCMLASVALLFRVRVRS